jgi:hypothetical protein
MPFASIRCVRLLRVRRLPPPAGALRPDLPARYLSWSSSPSGGSSPPKDTEEIVERDELLQKHKKRQELQPYWQNFEKRITSRKPRTDGPSGRSRPRMTEEDHWLASGAYDSMGAPTRSPPVADDAAAAAATATATATEGIAATAEAADSGREAVVAVDDDAVYGGGVAAVAAAAVGGAKAMEDGLLVRHATVAVRGPGTVAALVWSYRNEVQPVLEKIPGFRRVILLQETPPSPEGPAGASGDSGGGEGEGVRDVTMVHSMSIWEDAGSLRRATVRPEYAEAMGSLRKFFNAGADEVPRVAELTLLADLAPTAITK